MKHEFESNARLEGAALSHSLSAAGKFSGHSSANCDGQSSLSTYSPTVLHYDGNTTIPDFCESNSRLDFGTGTVNRKVVVVKTLNK